MRALLIAVLLGLVGAGCGREGWPGPGGPVERTRWALRGIASAIRAFQAVGERKLPATLADLAVPQGDQEPAISRVPLDAWAHPFHYERLDDTRFRLRSLGPDGQLGTPDDLESE